ncbi:MAG: hypothetical protein ACREQN_07750 [Candidatus Binataceae bacterium]
MEFEFFIGNVGRTAHDRHLGAYLPNLLSTSFKAYDERPAEDKAIDLTFIDTSQPNARGYVSFGAHQWNKRMYARRARCAVALTDATMIRTYGDVWMHVGDFAFFVDATPPSPDWRCWNVSLRVWTKPSALVSAR